MNDGDFQQVLDEVLARSNERRQSTVLDLDRMASLRSVCAARESTLRPSPVPTDSEIEGGRTSSAAQRLCRRPHPMAFPTGVSLPSSLDFVFEDGRYDGT
jgi:hypothetical protein